MWFRIDDPDKPAPKDGTPVLGFFPGSLGLAVMRWDNLNGQYTYHWVAERRWTPFDPTHWTNISEPQQ